MCVCVQGEDGIRDLVRSRGLGDVYKRQGYGRIARAVHHRFSAFGVTRVLVHDPYLSPTDAEAAGVMQVSLAELASGADIVSVSYTHLTLPTSDLV